MITIKNRNLSILGNEKDLGFYGDNLRKRVDFLIADKVNENAIFRLYLTFDDGSVNFLTLSEAAMDENGLYLVWNVEAEHIYKSGTVTAQIKAFESGEIIWHTTPDTFVVGASPEESRYLQRQNAEYLQREKELNELHRTVQYERTLLPYVGDNGNWFIYDVEAKAYVDSGKPSAYKIENPDIEDGAITEEKVADNAITGRKIALDEIGDEHLMNKYLKTNKSILILREGFLHDFLVQNSDELAKPYEHIYLLDSAGVDGLECIGIGRCHGVFVAKDKFAMHNLVTNKRCVVTFTEDEIVSVEPVKIDPDQIGNYTIGPDKLQEAYWRIYTSIITSYSALDNLIEIEDADKAIFRVLISGLAPFSNVVGEGFFSIEVNDDTLTLLNHKSGKSWYYEKGSNKLVETLSNKMDLASTFYKVSSMSATADPEIIAYQTTDPTTNSMLRIPLSLIKGKNDFFNLGEISDIKRLDAALGKNNYDTSKVYRFSFRDNIDVNDSVIPGRTAYIGYITNSEEYGLAIEFEPIISDGIKRILGFSTAIPNVYDYWEEAVIDVDSKRDFLCLDFDSLEKLIGYDYNLNKVYRIELTSDLSAELPKGVYIGRAYVIGSEYLELTSFIPDGYVRKLSLDTGKCEKRSVLNITEETDPNCHAEYFDITAGGELSLKPEYRGASSDNAFINSVSDRGVGFKGSLNEELPKDLVIPEVVNDITVVSFSSGMLLDNTVIESLTFPSTVEEIPENFANQAVNLREIKNTENIKVIGGKAFRSCRLEKAYFPNLELFSGEMAFANDSTLVSAEIGKVEIIPKGTFVICQGLKTVTSAGNVKTVGQQAFYKTQNLKNVDFISGLTSIELGGFWCSGIDYDWSTLTNCTFGNYATSIQSNPTDFWSNTTPTPCVNPLPTRFCQKDDRWKNKEIGTSGRYYGANGCGITCAIHAYCGIKNLSLSSVTEFEDIVNSVNPELINNCDGRMSKIADLLDGMGVDAAWYSASTGWNETHYKNIFETLNQGGYVIVTVGAPSGHVIVVYGVNEKGELLYIDSEKYYFYDSTKCSMGKLPFEKLIATKTAFCFVKP